MNTPLSPKDLRSHTEAGSATTQLVWVKAVRWRLTQPVKKDQ